MRNTPRLRTLRPRLTAYSASNTVRKARIHGPATWDVLAAMRIRVSDPALVGDLLEHLRRCGCEAMQTSRDIIAASFPHSLPYDAARLELDLHLADWRGKQAGTSAIVI